MANKQTKDGNPVRKRDVRCPKCERVVSRWNKAPDFYSKHKIDPSPGMPWCENSQKEI